MSTTDAKICLAIIAAVAVVGDSLAVKFGWCSISELTRTLDTATGGILRWFLLGLWLHFFIQKPFGGW